MKFFQNSVLLLSLLLPLPLMAMSNIEGIVDSDGEQRFVILAESGKRYKLFSIDGHVSRAIARLQKGDFVQGRGEIIEDRSSVRLSNIDFVGLYSLLGTWLSNYGEIFEFIDYS